jgi:hypothetical protein
MNIKIHTTVIIYLLLYMGGTCTLTLREEHRLRVCEKRGCCKRYSTHEEVTEGWRKLHTEELHDLYTLPKIIWVITSRRMWWVENGREKKCIQGFGWEICKTRGQLKDPGTDKSIT